MRWFPSVVLLAVVMLRACDAQFGFPWGPPPASMAVPAPTPAQEEAGRKRAETIAERRVDAGKVAHSFCSSPGFGTKATCDKQGVMGKEEKEESKAMADCPFCGTLYTPLVDLSTLPAILEPPPNRPSYNQFHSTLVSLACSGRTVVRAVFKVMDPQPPTHMQPGWKNCSNAGLVQVDENAENKPSPPTGAIRCELQVASGSSSDEVQRALQAKERPCYVCNLCRDGGGCPYNNNTWYMDSYTTTLQGCKFPEGEAYRPHRVGININPDAKILLAKFEVCNGSGCFNAAHEEDKAKNAKKCSNGIC